MLEACPLLDPSTISTSLHVPVAVTAAVCLVVAEVFCKVVARCLNALDHVACLWLFKCRADIAVLYFLFAFTAFLSLRGGIVFAVAGPALSEAFKISSLSLASCKFV